VVQGLTLTRLLVDSGSSLDEAGLLIADRSPGRMASREPGLRELQEIDASMQRLSATQPFVERGLRCTCPSVDDCTCALHEVTHASGTEDVLGR